MSIRETFRDKPIVGVAVGGVLLVVAVVVMAKTFSADRVGDLSQAFFSDDDGKTWFAENSSRVPPFDHNGKPAMGARVYTYAGGSKQFCAYLIKYTPEAKTKLEAAVAAAEKAKNPPGSVALFTDPVFLKTGMLVKPPGAGKEWMSYGDANVVSVIAIKSPDGSPVDEAFAN